MALTVLTNPTGALLPINTPQIISVESTFGVVDDLTYQIDVYLLDDATQLYGSALSTHIIEPNPSESAVFDCAKLVRHLTKYTTNKTDASADIIHDADDAGDATNRTVQRFKFTIREMLVGVENSNTDIEHSFIKGLVPRLKSHYPEFSGQFVDYILNSPTKKFLTNSPRTINITNTDPYTLAGYVNTTGGAGALNYRLEIFNDLGVSQSVVTIAINNTSNYGKEEVIFLGVAPVNLGISPTVGWYYEYKLTDDEVGTESETFTFNIIGDNCKYNRYQVAFINDFGTWDYYYMTKRTQIDRNIKRSEKQNLTGTWSGVQYDQYSWDEGRSIHGVSSDTNITLNTDWLTQAEADWLEELVRSPLVQVNYEGEWRAAIVTNRSYKVKETKSDKLYQLTLNLELSLKNTDI